MSAETDYLTAKDRAIDEVRACLELSKTSLQRAELLDDIADAVRDHVKFRAPGGQGLDGRDGPERQGLVDVLVATVDHADRERSRSLTQ